MSLARSFSGGAFFLIPPEHFLHRMGENNKGVLWPYRLNEFPNFAFNVRHLFIWYSIKLIIR